MGWFESGLALPMSATSKPVLRVIDSQLARYIEEGQVTENREYWYYLDALGRIKEELSITTVRAAEPNIEFFTGSRIYWADPRPGVLRIEAGAGCKVVTQEESPLGGLRYKLQYDRPIQPDDSEPYTFNCRFKVQSDLPTIPVVQHICSRLRAAIYMQFTPPALPEKIWWFRYPASEISQFEPFNYLPPDPGGLYYRVFFNLLDNEVAGIRWKGGSWRDEGPSPL